MNNTHTSYKKNTINDSKKFRVYVVLPSVIEFYDTDIHIDATPITIQIHSQKEIPYPKKYHIEKKNTISWVT